MAIKILAVDDSITIRKLIRKAFREYNCDILEAPNGVEGLALVNKEKPQLIILDITMPVMDGVEMLSRLKNESELKKIPVIMLTAEGGKEHVTKVVRMGVQDYIVKPFKQDELLERTQKVVRLLPRA
jgi:DNA-binding response OmpR family regulator